MAIGRFLGEAISEGIVFRWIAKAFGAIIGSVKDPAVREILSKTLLEEKGLDDESIFSSLLARANITPAKRRKIRQAIQRLEARNPRFASNFRVIVAMDAIGRGTMKVTRKGRVVERPEPDYRHPGLSILEELARCQTQEEVDIALLAMGVFNDAPYGTLDEIKTWVLKVALPQLLSGLDGVAGATGSVVAAVVLFMNVQYNDIDRRRELRRNARRRNRWNWINPLQWWEGYKDLF